MKQQLRRQTGDISHVGTTASGKQWRFSEIIKQKVDNIYFLVVDSGDLMTTCAVTSSAEHL